LLARKNNVDQEILKKIIEEVYKEFPNDQMLAELHVVRALKKYIESDSK